MEANQIRALNAMIDYIILYQNKVAFSFLFTKVFLKLLEKGIRVSPLLESDIFCYTFELEDWPMIHGNN